MTEGPVSSTGSLSSSRLCTSLVAPAHKALTAENDPISKPSSIRPCLRGGERAGTIGAIPLSISFSMRNNLAATFCRGPADELTMVASSSSAVVRYLHGMKSVSYHSSQAHQKVPRPTGLEAPLRGIAGFNRTNSAWRLEMKRCWEPTG